MPDCVFCRIATGEAEAVVLHEDAELVAFLDRTPIRRGHSQIIPRRHYDTFELLPIDLATKIVAAGQELARRMKSVYEVERVAFAFTGGDVAHAHAHLIPMHEKTDVTSARYIVGGERLQLASDHLHMDRASLVEVKRELGF